MFIYSFMNYFLRAFCVKALEQAPQIKVNVWIFALNILTV